jgi:hypothetical protein
MMALERGEGVRGGCWVGAFGPKPQIPSDLILTQRLLAHSVASCFAGIVWHTGTL